VRWHGGSRHQAAAAAALNERRLKHGVSMAGTKAASMGVKAAKIGENHRRRLAPEKISRSNCCFAGLSENGGVKKSGVWPSRRGC